MDTILVQRQGAAFWPREKIAERSPKERSIKGAANADQGDCEAIIRHLVKRSDIRVVYFGHFKSRLYNTKKKALIDGCEIILPHTYDYDEYTTKVEQQEGFALDLEEVAALEPKLIIVSAGYASSVSMLNNPSKVSVQTCALRYYAPLLAIQHALKLQRIVVCNDLRAYPKEQEINYMNVVPCALLSQREQERVTVIAGKRWRRREVLSGAENWIEPKRLEAVKTTSCTMISHAHIATNFKQPKRDAIFHHILDGELPKDFHIYGNGWEHYSGYDPEYMHGPVREPFELLAQAVSSPMLAPTTNYATYKPKLCVAQRCVPLYWSGESHGVDPLHEYYPDWAPTRLRKPGDLLWAAEQLENRDNSKLLDALWQKMRPDFSLLDSCIDDVLSGRDMKSESWWQKYGGYQCES